MTDTIPLTKPQEPWIGSRGRIGVIIPSTNIAVEYDCQRILAAGVTWHFARFLVEQIDLSTDDAFMAFIRAIRHTIPHAVRDIMTAEPSYIMMGMSAETFWGGLDGNAEFVTRLREQCGPEIGITTGARSMVDALARFGARSVAVLTPYQPIVDAQVLNFFADAGIEVKRLHGLKCDTANSIAHTPRGQVTRIVLDELDGDDVDAIVQVGTNLSTLDTFPALETLLQKPLIPINIANMWHALRAIGVDDRFVGKGWLMERF